MQIILLDKINKLGKTGDKITVKSGYARNFLIPKGKATIATKKNIQYMQKKIDELNETLKLAIQNNSERAKKINDIKQITIIAKSGEKGKLFGSIGKNNISEKIYKKYGIIIKKNEVKLTHGALRITGKHIVNFQFKNQIRAQLIINVVAEKNKKK